MRLPFGKENLDEIANNYRLFSVEAVSRRKLLLFICGNYRSDGILSANKGLIRDLLKWQETANWIRDP